MAELENWFSKQESLQYAVKLVRAALEKRGSSLKFEETQITSRVKEGTISIDHLEMLRALKAACDNSSTLVVDLLEQFHRFAVAVGYKLVPNASPESARIPPLAPLSNSSNVSSQPRACYRPNNQVPTSFDYPSLIPSLPRQRDMLHCYRPGFPLTFPRRSCVKIAPKLQGPYTLGAYTLYASGQDWNSRPTPEGFYCMQSHSVNDQMMSSTHIQNSHSGFKPPLCKPILPRISEVLGSRAHFDQTVTSKSSASSAFYGPKFRLPQYRRGQSPCIVKTGEIAAPLSREVKSVKRARPKLQGNDGKAVRKGGADPKYKCSATFPDQSNRSEASSVKKLRGDIRKIDLDGSFARTKGKKVSRKGETSRKCHNCGCGSDQTRQWVKGRKGVNEWLCHGCGQYWRKNQTPRPPQLYNRPVFKRLKKGKQTDPKVKMSNPGKDDTLPFPIVPGGSDGYWNRVPHTSLR